MSKQIDFLKRCIALNLQSGGLLDLLDRIEELERERDTAWAQAHNALGQTEKARLTMEVVQEFACEENATWAKIARKKGLCAPADEPTAVAQTNPAFKSD